MYLLFTKPVVCKELLLLYSKIAESATQKFGDILFLSICFKILKKPFLSVKIMRVLVHWRIDKKKNLIIDEMDDIKEITSTLTKFRNERDWEQFHNPKDLALAISIEAGELLELFLWKEPEDAEKVKVKKELADVFAYAFLLADKLDFDVKEIVLDKIKENGEKYPVNKAKGNAKKYNEL